MSRLRERFIQDLKLSGRSERTIDCYVGHIKKLAHFYHTSPDLIDEEELRKYLLSHTRLMRYRVIFATLYSLGLRIQKGVNLQVADIDSARGLVHVHRGKGAKACPERSRRSQLCRTPTLGGQVYLCSNCGQIDYSYHSCNDRNCPQCGGDKTQAWIKKQFDGLLPAPYFFVGFTLPEEFRTLARSHQLFFYNLFFKTSSQALKDLAKDKRFVGGEIGFLGILQTLRQAQGRLWARNLIYHPHIHYLVPGVALSPDHKRFRKIKNKKFLIHVLPLGRHFKYLFQKALKKKRISMPKFPKGSGRKACPERSRRIGLSIVNRPARDKKLSSM